MVIAASNRYETRYKTQNIDFALLASQMQAGIISMNDFMRQFDSTWKPRLESFVYRTLGDRDRAEEIYQEAAIRIFRHLPRYDSSKSFTTWIYTITNNLVKNELRNRGRDRLVQLSASGSEDDPHSLEQLAVVPKPRITRDQQIQALQEEIAHIPITYREATRLRIVEGLRYDVIADILDLPLGTTKSRIHRGKMELRARKDRIKRRLDDYVLAR